MQAEAIEPNFPAYGVVMSWLRRSGALHGRGTWPSLPAPFRVGAGRADRSWLTSRAKADHVEEAQGGQEVEPEDELGADSGPATVRSAVGPAGEDGGADVAAG